MKQPPDSQEKNTEQKILEAARTVFIMRGLDGARMQEIADVAGINKALLHYYFRSKENLFGKVFESALSAFLPRIFDLIGSETPFFEKIRLFVHMYIDLLEQNPYIPQFIIREINRDPEHLVKNMEQIAGHQLRTNLKKLEDNLIAAKKAGMIREINMHQFVVNMMSLCIFPFVARPIISGIIFQGRDEQYKNFLSERREQIAEFIISAIKA